MKKLMDYEFALYPLTAAIATSFDECTNLHRLQLSVDVNTYQEQLQDLKSSRLAHYAKKFDLTQTSTSFWGNLIDCNLYSNAIVDACKAMLNLYILHLYSSAVLGPHDPGIFGKHIEEFAPY